MNLDNERKAFEEWFCKNHTGLKPSELIKFRTNNGYSFKDSIKINCMWESWLADASRDGYKLVPVEPTQEMVDKAVCDVPETPSQDYWHDSQPISDDQAIACYKAMIGE